MTSNQFDARRGVRRRMQEATCRSPWCVRPGIVGAESHRDCRRAYLELGCGMLQPWSSAGREKGPGVFKRIDKKTTNLSNQSVLRPIRSCEAVDRADDVRAASAGGEASIVASDQ